MKQIGTIVRLQVQQSSLKVGPSKQRSYDPSPLHAVPALTLNEGGVTGIDETGASIADVHHRDHPSGKNIGENDISILFTAHYRAMRAHFGDHLTDGIAGESILVDTEESVQEEGARAGFTIRTAGHADIFLEEIKVSEPCVEFTRFSIHYPPNARSDRQVTDALAFLRSGMRGYYLRYSGEPVTVKLGDAVLLGAG